MGQALANLTSEGGLFRTRSLATLVIVGTFCWGFIDGIVSPDLYVPVVSIVVTFYFAVRAVQAGVVSVNGGAGGSSEPPVSD